MQLPDVTISYGPLYQMLFPPIRTKLLLTGIELHIFNYLCAPISAEEVADAIHTHPQNTAVFLDGLTAINLVQKHQSLYQNTLLAQAFLVEDSSTYLGHLLTFMARMDTALEHLTTLVKEGPTSQPSTPRFSEDLLTQAAAMMVNVERAGDAQHIVNIVSKLPEFPSFQKMLDLGGGPGLIGMAIVDAHPTMKGVIFDLPPVIQVAQKYITQYSMEKRMEVSGGDFNRDNLGEGYDLVVTSNALQFAQTIDAVMTKILDALNSGGVCVSIFGFGHTHERTKPENLVLGLLSNALVDQSMEINQGYIADAMLRAGFKSVHSTIIHMGWGPMELDIARK
jgi:predicted TPR repeat methyltransferase